MARDTMDTVNRLAAPADAGLWMEVWIALFEAFENPRFQQRPGAIPHHSRASLWNMLSLPDQTGANAGMRLLTTLVAILLGLPVLAAEPYRMDSITLMQPESEFAERVQSAEPLADYIQKVQAAAGQALTGEQPHPASGYLVLAVRPAGRAMVWLDFTPDLPAQTADRLRQAILSVPGVQVRSGVIVFALNSSLWGAPPTNNSPKVEEWKKAMEGHKGPMEVGDLVDKVWPDSD